MYPDEFTEITQNPTGLVPGVRNVSQTVACRVSDRRKDERLDAVKDFSGRGTRIKTTKLANRLAGLR